MITFRGVIEVSTDQTMPTVPNDSPDYPQSLVKYRLLDFS